MKSIAISNLRFDEIIGESAALKEVLRQLKTISTSDAAVLILGERGTGKELMARALHRLSLRRNHSFVKVNCSGISAALLERKLFGYEKAAFEGAANRRVGSLELATQGTLLLREIGEVPLQLQPKLLRSLASHEFARLGNDRSLPMEVRWITTTTHDLAADVARRRFHKEFYRQLSLSAVVIPPLRERREDIPLLVRYFAQKFGRRMNKHIDAISPETMRALVRWDWPGNVRELEIIIERSVIVAEGATLRTPLMIGASA